VVSEAPSRPVQVEPQPRLEFPPARSPGALLGGALAAVSVAMAVSLVVFTAAALPSDRALGIAVALFLLMVAAIGALGAVECRTLRYTLGRAGLEVHSKMGWIRIRYEQVNAVEGAPPANGSQRPGLWPGALFGYATARGQRPWVSRATTRDPSLTVLVGSTRGGAVVITPADATGFKAALIQRARTAIPGSASGGAIRPSWLDRIARSDGWFRAGSVSALFVATLELIVQVSRTGYAPRHCFAAVAVIAANALLGYTVLTGFPGAARILVGMTLCGQVIAILW
jgi:hypothetical protein